MVEENNVNSIQNTSNNSNKTYGLNIAALVLGIVSIVLWCVWFISIPCGILALIFGIIGVKKPGKAMGITGVVTGAITIAIWIFIFTIAFVFGFITRTEDHIYDYYDGWDYSEYRYY